MSHELRSHVKELDLFTFGISCVGISNPYCAAIWDNLKYRHNGNLVSVTPTSILWYNVRKFEILAQWNFRQCHFCFDIVLLCENLKYRHNEIPVSVTPASILWCYVRKFGIPAQWDFRQYHSCFDFVLSCEKIWNTGTIEFLSMSLLLRYCAIMWEIWNTGTIGYSSMSLLLGRECPWVVWKKGSIGSDFVVDESDKYECACSCWVGVFLSGFWGATIQRNPFGFIVRWIF